MDSARLILEVDDVSMYYGKIQALRSVNLQVKEGSIVAVLGPNGAGKSSLFKTIMGICPPLKGQIKYEGKDVTSQKAWQKSRDGLVLVPENRGVFRELSVYENLLLSPVKEDNLRKAIEETFELFPVLQERKNQLAGTLSGGEQQMLVLGRAFIARPKLLLIDEMSMGLAPQIVAQLFDAVRKIRESGTTVVVIEQYINEALQISDCINIMRRGEVILSEATASLNSVDQIHEKYFGVTTQKEVRTEKPRVEILKESLQYWRQATNKTDSRVSL